MRATYDETTGRLEELAADLNGSGKIDSLTDIDGSMSVRAHTTRDGGIDRWECCDA